MYVGEVNTGVLLGSLLVFTACERSRDESKQPIAAPEKPMEPAAAPRVPEPPDPCPKSQTSVATNAPRLVADKIHVISEAPLRWVGLDKQVYELAEDPSRPTKLGAVDDFESLVWDDKYWYRRKCYDDCLADDSLGTHDAVERIDRITGESKRLGTGDYGLGNILLYGDHVYWGVFGHQLEGGVFRISKQGGAEEAIRIDPDARFEDRIQELRPYRDGILVEGLMTVGWIPASGPPRLILELTGNTGVGAAVLDDDGFVYVAEEGDRYWESKGSGYILRVPLAGGEGKKLAGPVKAPAAIASFGPNVYFMLENEPGVWAVPKGGGPTKRVLTIERDDSPCNEPVGLWADRRGLFWLLGLKYFGSHKLFFQPWSAIKK